MSAMDSYARHIVSKGYYTPRYDHLIVYTKQAANVLDEFFKHQDSSPYTLWGGYVRNIDEKDKKVYILISTDNPGVAFRKYRSYANWNHCYLDIVELFTKKEFPGIVTKEKSDMFERLLSNVPKEERLNKGSKFMGTKQNPNDQKNLGFHTQSLVKIGE